ncbi:MAG TPA: hypothetical protein VHV83_20860 [Armatimonadota bacterium]|nr:hypothetical protein [Armatimonadota bacterium]
MGLIPPSTVDAPIVYYAFGGGMGHVTRAAAILRQLRRLGGAPAVVLTNTTFPQPLQHEKIPYRHITAQATDELTQQLRQHLTDLTPRAVIVDVFADGIIGDLSSILPTLPCPKVLITRHVRASHQQNRARAAACYDLIIMTEDVTPFAQVRSCSCEPILIRSAGELFTREAAREVLGVDDDAPIVLAVSTGSVAWEDDFFRLLQKIRQRKHLRAHLRVASPRASATEYAVTHYPIVELFPGVDVVVGAGGYNLFHEVLASGVQGIFLPQHRRIDDQTWRTQGARVAQSPEELAMLLEQAVHATPTIPRELPCYANGAETAAREIANLLNLLPQCSCHCAHSVPIAAPCSRP